MKTREEIFMKLILKNHQSPGDIMMFTSLVRDIKKAYPHFRLRVKSSADALFLNNPNIEETELVPRVFNTNAKEKSARADTTDDGWLAVDVHYGDETQLGKDVSNPYSIHKCGKHKKHFMNGMIGYMNKLLDLDIKLTELRPDIYLTEEEKKPLSGLSEKYWVVVPGGKPDYPRKIWPARNWDALFEILSDVNFVQMGGNEADHIKPQFRTRKNLTDLTGKTSIREVLSLIYNAQGVITPITFAMHVTACFPDKPCIVVAGGGEHHTWEAYPGHDFLHTCGVLPCCRDGGCWSGECSNKNTHTGEQRCMEMLTAEIVADIVKKHNWEN